MKKTTLWFIIENDKIMLAMKKRWFGAGWYNGVGGKVEKWETIQQAMIREAKEEINIDILDLEYIWVLNFYFDENQDWNQSVYVYFIKKYTWEIQESEEMKPFWFSLKQIPYDKMWEDDKIWLKWFLEWDRNIKYNFYFNKAGKLRDYEEEVLWL